MTQSRTLVLASPFTQTLPDGRKIIHHQLTRLTVIFGAKINTEGRTVTVFSVSPQHPPLELYSGQFCAPPQIVRIREDFGPYQKWDTFDVDFHKPHRDGFVYATDRYKGSEAVELPLGICEPASQHTANIAACAV